MNSEQLPRTSKGAVVLMLVILVVMILLSIYANVQRLRRHTNETVTFTPAVAAPSLSPSVSPK